MSCDAPPFPTGVSLAGNRHASEKTKQALLSHDWHFGCVPEYVAEVSAGHRLLLQQLRTLARPVLALVPTHWLAPATVRGAEAYAAFQRSARCLYAIALLSLSLCVRFRYPVPLGVFCVSLQALLKFSPMAEVVHTRGVKDEHTLTLNPSRIDGIADELERFSVNSFAVYDAMLAAHRHPLI
jgi:hypothetical protein